MLKNVILALLVVALIGGITTVLVRSQGQTAEVDVRVRAKLLADGRTEFEVQQRQNEGWSESLFPSNPRLRADPVINRWYFSRAVTATAPVVVQVPALPAPPTDWSPHPATDGDVIVRVEYSVEADAFDGGLATVVRRRAWDDSYSYVEVSQVCRDGIYDIVVDSDFHSVDNTLPVVRYRLGNGIVQTLNVVRYSDAPYGYSPVDDTAFRLALQATDTLSLQFENADGKQSGSIALAGFFATEVQANLDYCGGSAPEGWMPVGDTAGDREIRLEYEVNTSIDGAPLSAVVSARHEGSTYGRQQLHLICDAGRLDVVLDPGESSSTRDGVPTIHIGIDDGEAEAYRWSYIMTLESGFSPDDDRAFLERLRNASIVTMQVGSGDVATLAVAGLMSTPAQGNIEYCGQY